jgi:hypothetical protein
MRNSLVHRKTGKFWDDIDIILPEKSNRLSSAYSSDLNQFVR